MELAERLSRIVRDAKITQAEIAHASALGKATVSRIASCEAPGSWKYATIRSLCHALPAFADAVIADLTKKSAARTNARRSQDRGKDTI